MENITMGDLDAYVSGETKESKDSTEVAEPEMTDTDMIAEVSSSIQDISHGQEKIENILKKRQTKGLYDALVHIELAVSLLESIK